MSLKQIEVECPCCESTLIVDVLTQRVLKHAPKAQLDETGKPILDESRWERAQDKIKNRGKSGGDAFDRALQKESGRDQELDDLFKKAQDKVKKRGSGESPEP